MPYVKADRMLRLYVSGPITKGNRSWNFYQACEAQRLLMQAGYAVLNPMLSMAHPDGNNIQWDAWIESDLAWVEVADAVVRLPGESMGADMETDFAHRRGIPVLRPADFECLAELYPKELKAA